MDKQEQAEFNKKLLDEFGYFDGNRPKFRITWSHDELEKRLVGHSPEGFELLTPQVVEKPKYRQWMDNRWILERLVEVPIGSDELTVLPTSWEPIWTFQDRHGKPIEPNFKAAKFLINNLLGQVFTPSNMAKYRTTNEGERAARIQEINELEELLYGNESKVGDSLAKDSAVGYGTRTRSDGFDPQQKVNKAMRQDS